MSTSNSTLGYLAALAGLGAGLIAIYQWLKNTECVTEGSMFYGGSVCGWLGLNPASATGSSSAPSAPPSSVPAASITPSAPASSVPAAAINNLSPVFNVVDAGATPIVAALGPQLQALAGTATTLPFNQWVGLYNKILTQRGEPSVTVQQVLGTLPSTQASVSIPLSIFIAQLTLQGMS